MRFIPTRIHGFLDYGVGLLLILSPFLFGFADVTDRAGFRVPVFLGVAAVIYSLLTKYELGALSVLPMPVHLGLDFASGLLLATSPWLFGFSNEVFVPHVILGVMEIGAALTTQTRPRLNSLAGDPLPPG